MIQLTVHMILRPQAFWEAILRKMAVYGSVPTKKYMGTISQAHRSHVKKYRVKMSLVKKKCPQPLHINFVQDVCRQPFCIIWIFPKR